MIQDKETNKIYFSDWLRQDRKLEMDAIIEILQKHNVDFGFLDDTEDWWCRDYMPIQVAKDKFVQYCYFPDYLNNDKDRGYITNPDKTLARIGINTIKTDLVIDGGNVVKCDDKVVMTEKVFNENPSKSHEEIETELKRLFDCEIVFLPWDKYEKHGHSDGIVRWIGDGKVLLTAYEEDPLMQARFETILSLHFEVKKLKFTRPRHSKKNTWSYINFLQTNKIIIIPALGTPEDAEALEQFKGFFPDYKGRIEQVKMKRVISKGGALNCVSWNIRV